MSPPVGEPLPYGDRLTYLAAQAPDATAVRVVAPGRDEQVLTRSDLERRANQVGRYLSARGVGVGDRVAVALQNSPELFAALFAAWKLGAVPVPVRWDLPDWERERVLDVVDGKVRLAAADLDELRATTSLPDGPLPSATAPQSHGICSSGSTGTPKVIVIEKPAVWESAGAVPIAAEWEPVARPQVILVPAPLYHTNGFAVIPSLLAGDELVVLAKFDAALFVDLVERHRVTAFTATPTMLQRVADQPGVDGRDLSSVRWVLQGGAMIAPSLVHRWLDLVGPEHFFMAYGMTEGLGLTVIRGDEWLAHPGSIGRGIRGTEIRILDDDGRPVPAGEVGEIFLRWPAGALYRYLGRADRLDSTADGFGSAGDMGWLDDDGYLYIADRRVDMIITGGANVFPAEVENALGDHPGIADVVVIGLPDPEWGHRVHAIVAPAGPAAAVTPEEVRRFAKERLAPYKVPKTVELVEAIPRSEATKVSRSALVAERTAQAPTGP